MAASFAGHITGFIGQQSMKSKRRRADTVTDA
jgi:hypothetical protein